MKKLLFLLVLTTFLSCSKNTTDYSLPFIGVWTQEEVKSNSGAFIDQKDGSYIEFSLDKTFTWYYSDFGKVNDTIRGTFTAPWQGHLELHPDDGSQKILVDVNGFNQLSGSTRVTAYFSVIYGHTGLYLMSKD